MPDVSGVARTAAATLPAALPSFFAAVVITPSAADSSGLSFFAIEHYSSEVFDLKPTSVGPHAVKLVKCRRGEHQ